PTRRFSPPKTFRPRDVEYVSRSLDHEPREVRPEAYDKQTLLRHQRWFLDAYGFQPFGEKAERFLRREVDAMVRSQLKPRLIFYRAADLRKAAISKGFSPIPVRVFVPLWGNPRRPPALPGLGTSWSADRRAGSTRRPRGPASGGV